MNWGPTLLGDNQTRFRLWAPEAPGISLELDQGAHPMHPAGDGWWQADAPVGPGARYRFRVAPHLLVPDPAARLQEADVHSASVVFDPAEYPWRNPGWRGRPWHETILYEVHAGAMGGFRAVAEALPRLRDLGITAIELMPIAAFPGAHGWGYDGVLPFAPDNTLGTPHDLMALVDAAHGAGLSIFLDVVYNHFGPDGAYLHVYARRFFDARRHTPWGAAIDFSQPAVRAYFEENALLWLRDYRFDGLRIDAAHAIGDAEWLDGLARGLRATLPGRHVHLVLENEHNAAHHLEPGLFDAQWNDDGHNILHRLLTGETEAYYADYAQDAAGKLALAMQQGFVFTGQTSHRGAPRGVPSGHLPPTAFVLFLQNHDQVGNRAFGERLAHLADPDALAAAAALLLLCPQIPLLFMGEEWAATAPFLYFTDHNDELAPLVRDGRRAEFAGFAAFSEATARETIPDPNARESFSRSAPDPAEALAEPHSAWLALYRRLLAMRHASIIPRLHGARSLAAHTLGEAAILATWRMGDGTTLAIACNLGAEDVACTATGALLFEGVAGASAALATGILKARCTVALLLDATASGVEA